MDDHPDPKDSQKETTIQLQIHNVSTNDMENTNGTN